MERSLARLGHGAVPLRRSGGTLPGWLQVNDGGPGYLRRGRGVVKRPGSGPFRLPGGGEAAATGKTFERRNLIQAWRGPDGKVIKWHVLSAYPEIVAELSELSAPETNRALSISLTKA